MTTKEKSKLLLQLLSEQGNCGKMVSDSLCENGTIKKVRMDESSMELVVETKVQLNC